MKSPLKSCSALLLAALLAGVAYAQPGPGTANAGPSGNGNPAAVKTMPRDCTQAPRPELCKERQEARQKAMEACKDKAGPDRRECLRAHRPAVDCAKAPQPQRCEERQKAREACQGKAGPEHRRCMNETARAK